MSIHFIDLPKDPFYRRQLAQHLNLIRTDESMGDGRMRNRWLAFCRGMAQAFWFAEHRDTLMLDRDRK